MVMLPSLRQGEDGGGDSPTVGRRPESRWKQKVTSALMSPHLSARQMHRNDYGGKDSSADRIEALEQQVKYLRNELALSKESYLDLQRHLEEAAWDREILIKLMQNLGRHYLESAIKVTRSDGLGALSGNLGIVLRKFIDTKKQDMIAEEQNKMQTQAKMETFVSLSLASLEESPISAAATTDPRTRARRNSLLLAQSGEGMIGTSGGNTDEQNADRDMECAQPAAAIPIPCIQAESSAQVGLPEPDSNVIEVAELMKLLTRDELMSLKAAASRQYSEWLENQLMQERIQCVGIAPLDSKPDPEAITTLQQTLENLQAQFSGFTKSVFNATKRFLENVTDICNMSGDDDKWKIAYELTHRSAVIAPSLDNGETDKLVSLLQKAFDLVERKLTEDATQLEATYVSEAGSSGRTSVSNQHFTPISPSRPHRTSLGNGSPAAKKQTSPVAGLQVTPTRLAARKQKSAVIEDPTPLLFKPQYFKSQFVPHTNFITSCSEPESPLTPNIKVVERISSPPTPTLNRPSDDSQNAMTARSDNSDSNSVFSAEVSPLTSPFSVHQPSRRATPSIEALKAITNACPLPPHQQRQRQPNPSPLQAVRMSEKAMRRRSTGYIRLESVDVQRLEELEV